MRQTPNTQHSTLNTQHSTPNTNNYELSNYPNPFNQSTTIEAMLPQNSNHAYLLIHDVTGKEIYRKQLTKVLNIITLDGTILQNGIYICSIEDSGAIYSSARLVKVK
jgi:hypothetical protein